MNKKYAYRKFVGLCIAPALILFSVFMIVPTLNVFYMSAFKWSSFSGDTSFVGFGNFTTLMQDANFIRSFQNTILIIVVVTIVTLVLAILFAALLVREKMKGQNLFRVIFYIPNILSVVVISAIFGAIYDPSNNGLLNSILQLFHGEQWETIKFLGDRSIVVYAIIGTMIWQAIGYYMVMYMASMSSIPEHLYEAAQIEGAGKVTQFFQITLPLIWTNLRTTLTFFIISTINLSFLFVKVMTNGGPDGASDVVLGYLYKQSDSGVFGYAMAIGVVVFLFSFALSAIINAITKREDLEF